MAEFVANGGCKCMNDGNDCDVADFIPVGCHKCGEEAGEYCHPGSGKISPYSYMQFLSYKNIYWQHKTNLKHSIYTFLSGRGLGRMVRVVRMFCKLR